MAKKKVEKTALTKSDEIAIKALNEQGKSNEEIAAELDIPLVLIDNQLGKQPKQKTPPLPFAIKKTGNSAFVQMTQAASEISDAHGPLNRSGGVNPRYSDCIFRPEE